MAEATFFAESEVQVTSSEVCILGRCFPVEEIEQVRLQPTLRTYLGYGLWIVAILVVLSVGLAMWLSMNIGIFPGNDNPLVPILSLIVFVGVCLIGGIVLSYGPVVLKISGRFGAVDLECGNAQYGARLVKAIRNAVAAYDTRLEHKSVVA